METLEETLSSIQKCYPFEYKSIRSCTKSIKHDWYINRINNPNMIIRAIDVVCRSCGTNLAVELKFFAGVQDHG